MDDRLFRGYVSLTLFIVALAVTLVVRPPIPIQTILLAIALIIMMIGNAKIHDLIAGVILHPIMAMTAGFLVAGALLLAGGFDALLLLLNWAALNTPLGIIGVAVLLANIPTILPMPCGRILAAALLPGVYLYAKIIAEITSPIAIPALIGAFIVNAAASCGPSPLGGIGGIGEGNLGVEVGSSGDAQSAGIMIATGVTAIVITFVTRGMFL